MVVSLQAAQTASKEGRELGEPSLQVARRVWRQSRHRCGSFAKPFSAKNCCSRTEKTNGLAQSLQVSVLSSKVSPSTALEKSGPTLATFVQPIPALLTKRSERRLRELDEHVRPVDQRRIEWPSTLLVR